MQKILFLILMFISSLFAEKNIWINTGKNFGIEPRLLYAISKVESNVTPLVVSVNHTKITPIQEKKLLDALNYAQVPYVKYPKTIEIRNRNQREAKQVIAFLDYYKYASFDIGLMQINNIHKETLAKENISLQSLVDAHINVKIGAKILLDCYKKHRSFEKTLNAYNGKLEGNDYYAKVYKEFQKLLLPHESSTKNPFYVMI